MKKNLRHTYKRSTINLYFIGLFCFSFLFFQKILFFNPIDFDFYLPLKILNQGINWQSILWCFKTKIDGNYVPLTWLTHLLLNTFFHDQYFYHFLFQLILHTVNTALVFYLLHTLIKDLFLSWLLSIIFLIHGHHIESICWLAERKGLLSSFFCLTSIIYILKAYKTNLTSHFTLSTFFFIFGLLSKPIAVMTPLLHILTLYSLGNNFKSFKLLFKNKKYICFLVVNFFLSLIFIAVTFRNQSIVGAVSHSSLLNIFNALSNIWINYSSHIYTFFDTSALFPFYISRAETILIQNLLPFLLFLLIAIYSLIKQNRILVHACFWFLIWHIPTIGFFKLGLTVSADRYNYLPIMGLITIFGLLLRKITRRLPLILIITTYLLYLTTSSQQYLVKWKDNETIWKYTLTKDSQNYFAYFKLGNHYAKKKKYQKSIFYLKKSIENAPLFEPSIQSLYYCYEKVNNVDQLNETLNNWKKIHPDSHKLNLTLYRKYKNTGEVKKYLYYLDKMANPPPTSIFIQRQIALAYYQEKMFIKALKYLKLASKTYFYDYLIFEMIGVIKYQDNDLKSAITNWEKSLYLGNPKPAVLINLLSSLKNLNQHKKLNRLIKHYDLFIKEKVFSNEFYKNKFKAILYSE